MKDAFEGRRLGSAAADDIEESVTDAAQARSEVPRPAGSDRARLDEGDPAAPDFYEPVAGGRQPGIDAEDAEGGSVSCQEICSMISASMSKLAETA